MEENDRRFLTSLVVALFMCLSSGQAQEYKPFRLGLGTGMIAPTEMDPGFLIYVEPSWRFSKKMSVGLRVETAGRFNDEVGIIGSYTINTQYYFFNIQTSHFFGGLGVGIYTPNRGLGASCTCEGEPKITVAGFYPRLGFEYRHMVITTEYNFYQSTASYRYVPTSYLAFKIGFFIGRRRK